MSDATMPGNGTPHISDHGKAEFVVIGSGPGGSVTAAILAEAGRDVLILEEGPFLPLESCVPFTREEMEQKYRSGGMTVALGRTKVAYVEGRCVGGGSEINSGLYHRIPPDIRAEWQTGFEIEAFSEADLEPHYQANEHDLTVSTMPGPAPAASLKLHEGATRLGWKSLEVPRWFAYQPAIASAAGSQNPTGVKQSMTKTFVPRALAGGAKLTAGVRVHRLRRRGTGWRLQAEHRVPGQKPRSITIDAATVILACGAIQTPTLLRRSGLGHNVGDSLHMHPTIKVTARFAEAINSADMGVPVHQVKEFSPRLSFGCSISAPPFLALAMIDHPTHEQDVADHWPEMAIYYAMIRGGQGSVRPVPFFRDPLVRYRLDDADLADLADGLKKLSQCLFAAGATVLYPSITASPCLRNEANVANLPAIVPPDRTNLMTIHLFSSCPMGENRKRCAADSFGHVHGEPNLLIADGSLLPGPPGVNPQGAIMAVARRNALRLVGKM